MAERNPMLYELLTAYARVFVRRVESAKASIPIQPQPIRVHRQARASVLCRP